MRTSLLNSSALRNAAFLALAMMAAPSLAQQEPSNSEPAEAGVQTDADVEALAEPQDDGEEIVVTGSRIARRDYATANPVTTLDAASIRQSGETNLTEYLQGVPALVGSLGSSQTSGSEGIVGNIGVNLLNLRNLGTERTLVLVDGRRHVAQRPESAAVDIGSLPVDLIERVEVVTGGAGAVYGADAVSGVVNFIMKKDFEGLTARGQMGVAEDGEPENWRGSIVGGINFAGGRGNLTMAFEANHEGAIRASDRAYLRPGRFRTLQQNPADPFDDPNLPDEVPMTDVRFFNSSREGAIDVNFDTIPDFRPNGEPFEIGEFIAPGYSIGGTGTLRSDFIGDVRARNDRYVGNVFFNYELSDAARFFAEAKYARSEAFSVIQPSFDYLIFISPDNALIPDAIRPQIEASGGAWINRDNFDLGSRAEQNELDTWRTVVGVEGNISGDIKYELSYVWGQTKVESLTINNRFDDRFFAAIDAVVDPGSGQIVCRSNLNPADLRDQPYLGFFSDPFTYGDKARLSFTPGAGSGCVPLNIFGEGAASAAAIDWVMNDSLSTSKLTQNVVSGFVSGNVPGIRLPGGQIGFVAGGEWRRESSRSTPAEEETLGLTFGNQRFPVSGDFDVKEAFAELRLPILRDRPFFELLELNGAIRVSDYSTIGTTTTWNVNGLWAPVSDISFRGTYAQAVRAPNIGELFSPQKQAFQFIADPCDADQLNNGSSTRAANCATILSALGFDPATFQDPNFFTVSGLQQGNPLLREETARSWTVGTIIRPRFVRGLTFSVDWYDIKIKDAINQASAEEIAENCVDAPSIDNVFCDALVRNPFNGGLAGFLSQPENVANFRTAGLDFNLNYRFDPADAGFGSDIGIFNFRVLGNYLHRLEFVPAPGAEVDDARTEQYAPKWQVTLDATWNLDPVTVNYGFNYFSKTKRYSNAELAGDPDLASPENINFDARHTHDIQVAIDVGQRFQFYTGINNFTDQKPDLATAYPVSPVGRFFYAGARLAFDKIF